MSENDVKDLLWDLEGTIGDSFTNLILKTSKS